MHLAAQAGVRYAMHHPEQYVHSNLDGFVSILELLRRHAGMPLILPPPPLSMGSMQKSLFPKTIERISQASFYGATKKSNEMMAHAYHHLYQIPCTALRFFTVYGPWGRPDMAYFSFAKAILEERPIPIFGDGTMQRDFTYIDDIIQGTIAAIDLSAPCEVFNLGNNRPSSVLESLCASSSVCSARRPSFLFTPEPRGEVPVTYADISKAKDLLGFHPSTPLREDSAEFIEWFEEYAPFERRTDRPPEPQE